MRLEGRRALVTGGGRGLGRAIVEAFAAEGAQVLAVARSAKELEEVGKLTPDLISTSVVDVNDREAVDALPQLVSDTLGGLDVLVNNAGVWIKGPFLEYSREDWDLTISTNLTSVFDVTQTLLPTLLESPSSRVINMASIDGQVGFSDLVAQCASKAGLVGFTKALAKELWAKPITVNAICPAEVDKDVHYADTATRVPEPARALPWDVARASVYLASDEAVRVTGTCLDVHGVGFLAS